MKNRTITTMLVAATAMLALADAAAAYYSPRLGRFLSRDPINEPGAVPLRTGGQASKFIPRDKLSNDGKNLYAFVVNSPVNQIDPVGLCTASGTLIQYRTPLAASDALRVGTPHQDLADQVVATINQEFKDYHIVVPKRTNCGPFKQGNTPYQAGGIQFQANDIVLGSFMVFMVFEICEADGPCIIESEETGTLTFFPQGGEPIPNTTKAPPLRPQENDHWKKAKRLNPVGKFDTSLIVVDSPASIAVTRAIGQQPPLGFSNQISHTIRVIDKNTNKTVASGTWDVTVGVDSQGNLTASP